MFRVSVYIKKDISRKNVGPSVCVNIPGTLLIQFCKSAGNGHNHNIVIFYCSCMWSQEIPKNKVEHICRPPLCKAGLEGYIVG